MSRRRAGHDPHPDGYFVVGRLAWWRPGRGKGQTLRRRKIYPVPKEVLALFGDDIADAESVRSIVGCSGATHEATVSRLAAVDLESG